MQKELPTISVRRLREELSIYPDDYAVSFSGLSFYRVKLRGEKLLQIEFEQIVYLDPKTGNVVIDNPEPL